jgi:protocatechuate 3,4-dioxygenase beta subunit
MNPVNPVNRVNRVNHVILMIALLGSVAADAQTRDSAPAAGGARTAAIGGRLVTGAGGALVPLRRGVVTVTGTGILGARQVVTDAEGRFVVDGLAPGRFAVSASKPGYLPAYFGNRVSYVGPATPIALGDGEQRLDLQLFVARGATIEGTVRDEFGRPLASAQVSARVLSPSRGVRRFVAAASGPDWVVTDDRGHYRVYGLPPGEYTVRAGVPVSANVVSAEEVAAARQQVTSGQVVAPSAPSIRRLTAAYYPDVIDEVRSSTVQLALAEDLTGIDITVRAAPVSTVSYLAAANSGAPLTQYSVGLANLSTGQLWSSRGGVRVEPETGRGQLPGLMPGRYLFFGSALERAEPNAPWYLFTEFDLGTSDIVDLPLTFQPGVRVAGRVTVSLADGQAPPSFAGARVELEPAPEIRGLTMGATRAAAVGADGRFSIDGAAPGTYQLRFVGLPGWTLVSAVSQGIETLDASLPVGTSIDVTDLGLRLSAATSEISGQVVDGQGRAASELMVVAMPVDRALWTSARRIAGPAHVGTDGHYEIRGLPAGRYVLAVVVSIEARALEDPAVLEQLAASGVVVDLAEGQHLTQHLKVGG